MSRSLPIGVYYMVTMESEKYQDQAVTLSEGVCVKCKLSQTTLYIIRLMND